MDKATAVKIMALAVATDRPIADMFEVVEQIDDGETRERFKRAIETLVGAIMRDIFLPIETIFPDLIPDKN